MPTDAKKRFFSLFWQRKKQALHHLSFQSTLSLSNDFLEQDYAQITAFYKAEINFNKIAIQLVRSGIVVSKFLKSPENGKEMNRNGRKSALRALKCRALIRKVQKSRPTAGYSLQNMSLRICLKPVYGPERAKSTIKWRITIRGHG